MGTVVDPLQEKQVPRVWIITSNQDYCIKCGKDFLLNPLLRRNLVDASGAEPEIHCFDNLSDGITDFGNAGVTATKLPTELEAAEIKKEMEALPHFGWMPTTADDAVREMILFRNGQIAAICAIPGIAAVAIGSTPPAGDTPETPK